MLDSSLSPVIEESEGAVGGSVQYHILAHMLDEAGLERMGYKQELRYVQSNLCALVFQNL
jgi:hypothetical protein